MAEIAAPDRREEIRQSIVAGRDGFLFHRFDRAFEQICGEITLSAEQTARWIAILQKRHDWCRSQGIDYSFLVAPEKHVIYEDKLPAGMKVSADRPISKILSVLPEAIRGDVIYPAKALKAGREIADTYYRTDVHWTDYGAYLAYLELVKILRRSIAIEPIPEQELLRRKLRMVGDLGVRMDPEPIEESLRITHARATDIRKVYGNQAFGRGQAEVFETEAAEGPTGVIFRDSNMTAMLPFLALHFSRLVVVSAEQFFDDVVRAERPDVVITEMTERYLTYPGTSAVPGVVEFPEDFPADGFVAFTGVKLPLPSGKKDFSLDFRAGGDGKSFTGEGWSGQEENHIWSLGTESSLSIPIPAENKDYILELDVMGCTPPPHTAFQRLQVSANGHDLGSFKVGLPVTVSCKLPKDYLKGQTTLNLKFVHPDCVSPKEAGFSDDSRLLGVALSALRLRPQG
jgi:alginate O-acetyltransferase complex protein AlgJ